MTGSFTTPPKSALKKPFPARHSPLIGEVVGSEVYPFEMFPGFVPYRRDIRFLPATETPIRPLIEQLAFIKDKSRWGYAFRFGHLEIVQADFELIASRMLGHIPA